MAPRLREGLVRGEDGVVRCGWCVSAPDYAKYHDEEWGRPVHDDQRLFEKICLEGFQSGLSWLTILRKRENFRRAFADFDYHEVARFNQRSVGRLIEAALMKLSKTPTSTRLSKELKRRGWTYVGPTTVYAFMQAMGLVNDHIEGCFVRTQ